MELLRKFFSPISSFFAEILEPLEMPEEEIECIKCKENARLFEENEKSLEHK